MSAEIGADSLFASVGGSLGSDGAAGVRAVDWPGRRSGIPRHGAEWNERVKATWEEPIGAGLLTLVGPGAVRRRSESRRSDTEERCGDTYRSTGHHGSSGDS